jgi:hypothetical protein
VEADLLSKTVDSDDWSVQNHIFKFLNAKYGPFTIDLFASNLSKKVDRFFAKYWCKGNVGVDAFAYNWKNENCWIVPPPSLVAKTIKHLKCCQAKGVLVVPRWQTAMYWPIIHNGKTWQKGIKLLLEYKSKRLFPERPIW